MGGFAVDLLVLAEGGEGVDALTSADMFLVKDFRLDRSGLSRRDQNGTFVPIPIGSRALEILAVLVKRPGDLVTRDEIIKRVWPATIVEYSNLPVQMAALRRHIDQGRVRGSCIQTVPGRGYRFIAPVTRTRAGARGDAASFRPTEAPLPPDKPSIVVLPFQNMSGELEQEYFVDGMVEEMPSRPGEFHPEPLTDPDVILSHHPARAPERRPPPSVEK